MRRRIRDFTRMREFRPALRKFLVAEGAAGILVDSNKEHGLVNMTTAVEQLHPGRAARGILDHRVLWPDLAAAQARAGRDRDRPEEHVQHR